MFFNLFRKKEYEKVPLEESDIFDNVPLPQLERIKARIEMEIEHNKLEASKLKDSDIPF